MSSYSRTRRRPGSFELITRHNRTHTCLLPIDSVGQCEAGVEFGARGWGYVLPDLQDTGQPSTQRWMAGICIWDEKHKFREGRGARGEERGEFSG
jgi:hypothetical protein